MMGLFDTPNLETAPPLSLLYCCLAGLLMAVSYQHFLASASSLLGRLVAAVLFPPCFGAPPWLGGYKPHPEYWDLDREGRKPVLFSFKTPFSEVKAYYIPPLQLSSSRQLIVGYPGNTRAVGAIMSDIWKHFGSNVHMILVNPPGYGNFEADRSSPMKDKKYALFEAWLRAIPATLKRAFLDAPKIDWDKFDPQTVIRGENGLEISPCPMDKLPRTFVGWNIVPYGRSFGGFLAARIPSNSRVYWMPLQSIKLIDPAGLHGIIWKLIRRWNPFPTCKTKVILDAWQSSLTEDEKQFLIGYNGDVFTGLALDFATNLKPGQTCLLAVASRENVVGRMENLTPNADGVRVIVVDGDHRTLPNEDFGMALRKYLEDSAAAHGAGQPERE